MPQLDPPLPPPPQLIANDDSWQRLQFRLWQVLMTTLTVFVAVWITSYGRPLATIVAWVVAKHIFVAILLMGLDRYPRYKGERKPAV